MLLEFFLWLAMASSPSASAHTAAAAVGEPGMEVELLRICKRETVGPGRGECRAVSVHAIDSGHSRGVHTRAVAVGWLSPGCQPYGGGGWSTRGPWGLMAAYNLKWVGVPCLPPWVLDVPLVSATAAARKLKAHCETPKNKRHPATTRWGRCDWRAPRSL
jgi:hypothetical protein